MRIDDIGRELIRLALREDLSGYGDVTSEWTVAAETRSEGFLVTRDHAVVSGLDLAAAVLAEVDEEAVFERLVTDGSVVAPGVKLARLEGAARSLLAAERTLLNIVAHLCGVATQARRFADAVAGTSAVAV